jgi:hypothetical protein
VTFIAHAPASRRAGVLPAVLAAALVALLALAGPAWATSGPTKLLDPSVSPREAPPGTPVEFAVTYRNREGSAPDYVRVVVGGAAHPMAPLTAAETYKDGVRFAVTLALPLGVHDVRFEGMDRDKFTDEVAAGTVTIASPAPPPPTATPTPTAAPSPTAAPAAPTPTAAPSPAAPAAPAPTATPATGGAGTVTGGDTGTGTTGGTTTAGTATGDTGTAPGNTVTGSSGAPGIGPGTGLDGGDQADIAAVPGAADHPAGGGVFGSESASPDERGSTSAPDGGVAPRPGAGDTTDGASGGPTVTLASGLPSALGGPPIPPSIRVLSVLVTTTGGVAMAMAFMLFGKRRRDGEPTAPDEVLQAAAARGPGLAASAGLVRPAAVLVDPDAHLPRWRRPSLLEARKNDPLRSVSTPTTLTFAQGVAEPVAGRERRRIRYRLVRLLDSPDELRSMEIGSVDEGDEVQLLERSGAYWLVLCPDGQQGWLHKMVLGDAVVDDPDVGPELDGFDEEAVFAAFLETRAREA